MTPMATRTSLLGARLAIQVGVHHGRAVGMPHSSAEVEAVQTAECPCAGAAEHGAVESGPAMGTAVGVRVMGVAMGQAWTPSAMAMEVAAAVGAATRGPSAVLPCRAVAGAAAAAGVPAARVAASAGGSAKPLKRCWAWAASTTRMRP